MFGRRLRVPSRASAIGAVLAAAVAASTLGPPAPARADHELGHDPEARIQFVVNKIKVHDDRDWGAGDIVIRGRLWEVKDGCTADSGNEGCFTKVSDISLGEFEADDGDTKVLNRVVISAPVYEGRTYRWQIKGTEIDTAIDDEMGELVGHVNAENGWGPFGTYFERGTVCYWELDFPGTTVGCDRAAYISVEYEVRRAPLPDLTPRSMEVVETPGSANDSVCVGVLNAGREPAPYFYVTLKIDGEPATETPAYGPRLEPGQGGATCLTTELPKTGQHRFTAIVDEGRTIPEENEKNNVLDQGFIARVTVPGDTRPGVPDVVVADPGTGSSDQPGAPSGGPQPGAGAGADQQAGQGGSARPAGPLRPGVPKPGVIKPPDPDLFVSAIEVVGRDDKGCVAGKNQIIVTVKTSPEGSVGEFAVQTKVDGELIDTATVSGLPSNSERKIQSVMEMRPGTRTVQAIVDSGNKVTEDNETNNTRTVEVNCPGP